MLQLGGTCLFGCRQWPGLTRRPAHARRPDTEPVGCKLTPVPYTDPLLARATAPVPLSSGSLAHASLPRRSLVRRRELGGTCSLARSAPLPFHWTPGSRSASRGWAVGARDVTWASRATCTGNATGRWMHGGLICPAVLVTARRSSGASRAEAPLQLPLESGTGAGGSR